MPRKLLLLDGNSLAHRAFFALPDLKAADGTPTNAIYGFLTMLLRLLDEEKPQAVAVAFDKAGPTFRHARYDSYKANRPGMADNLAPQFPLLKEVLQALGLTIIEKEGFEADDLIGTLATRADKEGWTVRIVTGDRDALQLVTPTVLAILTVKGVTDTRVFDPAAVEEKYGVRPDQITDLKGLMGDASDNIPGVPGVGEKTAVKLIKEFGSVEALLADTGRITPERTRRAVEDFRDRAVLSKELATIDRNVPVEAGTEDFKVKDKDRKTLAFLLARLEMKSLARRIGVGEEVREAATEQAAERAAEHAAERATANAGASGAGTGGGEETGAGARRPETAGARYPETTVRRLKTLEEMREFAGRLGLASLFGTGRVHIIYSLGGDRPMEASVHGLALGAMVAGAGHGADPRETKSLRPAADGETECLEVGVWVAEKGRELMVQESLFSVPASSYAGSAPAETGERSADPTLRSLGGLLENEAVELIGHDLKPLLVMAGRDGLNVSCGLMDTTVGAYLLDPTRSGYPLGALVREFLQNELPPAPTTVKGVVDPEALAAHLASQCAALPALAAELSRAMEEKELAGLYQQVEMPLLRVLAAMEVTGVGLDRARLEELGDEFTHRLEDLTADIYKLAGYEFNINSTRQLAEVLYGKMQLPILKKTSTGAPSTDAEVLEELAHRSPIVERILEHRSLSKLKGTYIEGLRTLVNSRTGRVHTSFNQTVTATGRLSSSDPNLQNIPIREEVGRRIRRVFIPGRPGDLILAADYSQIELRVLAHLSEDPVLCDAFMKGEDIHRRTAAEVFGVPLAEVSPQMRDRAKAVNFGIVYGISDYGLSRNTGVARGEAKRYIESYFARYAGVKAYMDETIVRARRVGYVTTILRRRRYLPDLHNRNFNIRSFAERTAMNTPIQGSAADIIKVAMVRLAQRLTGAGPTGQPVFRSRMILQVHDELIFEVPPDELAEVAAMVKKEMEGAVQFRVPLRVDLKVGPNWYEVKPLA